MLFSQAALGVEIFSPLGILILVIGVAFTVGVPVAPISQRQVSKPVFFTGV